MTDKDTYESLTAHLQDLREKSERWHTHTCSGFLNEEETAVVMKLFPASDYILYDGGYPNARKKKVIFRYDPEDDFSDVICLCARIDQRFRKIGHRDILGALMHLQIERNAFGDFWIEDNKIYLYTSEGMEDFFTANLTRINQLSVHFRKIDDHPEQIFHTKELHVVCASERMDALVAGLARVSRSEAKNMIRQGLVQCNHIILEHPDEVCDNDGTISIRGVGRFIYKGYERKTRSDRIVASFEQFI